MSKKHNITKEERMEQENYERYKKSLKDDSNIDWTDAKIDGVTIDGVPLDGDYLEHLLDDSDDLTQSR